MNRGNFPNIPSLSNLPKRGGAAARWAAGAVALVVLGANSLYTVDGGHRAVIFNKIFGVSDRVVDEGTHVKIPFVEQPIIFDVRNKPRNVASLTGSKDLQMVNITLRVLSKPREDDLPKIYQRLGTNYDDRVLPSIVNEVLKSVVAQFNASQLIVERELVSRLIRTRLVERANEFHMILNDVSITHLSFGKEYTAAVEAKEVAHQEVERAKFIVEKAQQDRLSIIVKAEGEAQSAKMISEAIKNNPNFLQLRKIEAAKDIAEVVARGGNRVFLNSDNLLFDLLKVE